MLNYRVSNYSSNNSQKTVAQHNMSLDWTTTVISWPYGHHQKYCGGIPKAKQCRSAAEARGWWLEIVRDLQSDTIWMTKIIYAGINKLKLMFQLIVVCLPLSCVSLPLLFRAFFLCIQVVTFWADVGDRCTGSNLSFLTSVTQSIAIHRGTCNRNNSRTLLLTLFTPLGLCIVKSKQTRVCCVVISWAGIQS